MSTLLTHWGWTTPIEVTYSIFGGRGSVDLLAWHPATRTLVVFEIKTELGSVEGLLRPPTRGGDWRRRLPASSSAGRSPGLP